MKKHLQNLVFLSASAVVASLLSPITHLAAAHLVQNEIGFEIQNVKEQGERILETTPEIGAHRAPLDAESKAHEIIKDGTKRVLIYLEKVNSEAEKRLNQLASTKTSYQEQLEVVNDMSRKQAERMDAQTAADIAFFKYNYTVRELAKENLNHFGKIDDELQKMLIAAREIDQRDEARRLEMMKIASLIQGAKAPEKKLPSHSKKERNNRISDTTEFALEVFRTTLAMIEEVPLEADRPAERKSLAPRFEGIRKTVAKRRESSLRILEASSCNLRTILESNSVTFHSWPTPVLSAFLDELWPEYKTMTAPSYIDELKPELRAKLALNSYDNTIVNLETKTEKSANGQKP